METIETPDQTIGRLLAELKKRDDEIAHLGNLAVTDELTGLKNRRGFNEALEEEIGRVTRFGGCFVLLSCDLDFFKSVNDLWGHPYGDEVLIRLGGFLDNNLRQIDTKARIGGDEFGLILPQTTKEQVGRVIQKLKENFSEDFKKEIDATQFGISIGFHVFERGIKREQFLKEVDQKLYAQKTGNMRRKEYPNF